MQFLRARGYQIVAAPWRTPFAQLDVVAYHLGTLALIEVKKQRLGLSAAQLVSAHQRRRLRRAHQWVVGYYQKLAVRSILAVVSANGQITWFADFLS